MCVYVRARSNVDSRRTWFLIYVVVVQEKHAIAYFCCGMLLWMKSDIDGNFVRICLTLVV